MGTRTASSDSKYVIYLIGELKMFGSSEIGCFDRHIHDEGKGSALDDDG